MHFNRKWNIQIDKKALPFIFIAIILCVIVLLGYALTVEQTQPTGHKQNPADIGNTFTSSEPTRAPARDLDVIFVSTPHEVIDIMLRLADVKADDVVYDLGCGDGRIVIAAAKKTGARSYGFDMDPARVEESIENVKKEQLEDIVTIEEKDIFELDLSEASVVTLYLLPSLNVKLIPQLQKLKPGSRIVSHYFDMEGVEPDVRAEVNLPNGLTHSVYLWIAPLRMTDKESFYQD